MALSAVNPRQLTPSIQMLSWRRYYLRCYLRGGRDLSLHYTSDIYYRLQCTTEVQQARGVLKGATVTLSYTCCTCCHLRCFLSFKSGNLSNIHSDISRVDSQTNNLGHRKLFRNMYHNTHALMIE